MSFENFADTSIESVRRRLRAEMRTVTMLDSTGVAHAMVWIPRFIVPAGLLGPTGHTWPSQDLELGGFFVDQYQNANLENLGPVDPALVSAPGLNPVCGTMTSGDGVTREWAQARAGDRVIFGRACSLPTLAEWAALTCIPALLGHELHGNNAGGRDSRDPDTADYKGVPFNFAAAAGRILAGTGPNSYSLTGGPHAPFDVLGNVAEWLYETAPGCRLEVTHGALIEDAGGISAGDLQLTIGSVENLDRWPLTDGVIRIETETIKYGTLTDNNDGTVVLGALTRGHRGTTAAIHTDGYPVYLAKDFCLVPGGLSVLVTGLANTTNPVTFTVHDPAPTPSKTAIEVGDVIAVGSELITVTAVSGSSVTASRGTSSTTIASHANWSRAVVRGAQATWTLSTGTGTIRSFRVDDPDIEPMMLPDLCVTGGAQTGDVGDKASLGTIGLDTHAIARGGHASDSANRHGWAIWVTPDAQSASIGCRCVWRTA